MKTFGIELEIVGLSMDAAVAALSAAGLAARNEGYTHATTAHWKVVRDASIIGQGCEVVSPVLEATEEGFNQVKIACDALVAAGARVNSSCGCHVHVGGTGSDAITLDGAKNVLKISAKLDDVIDQVVSPSRRAGNNRYAKSVVATLAGLTYQASDDIEVKRSVIARAFMKIDQCRSWSDLRNAMRNDRYHKINIESITRHGTIEFRQHQGSVNASKVLAWVRLCVGLVTFANRARAIKNRRQEKFAYVIWMAKGGHTEHGLLPTETKRFLSKRVRELSRGAE